MVSFRHSFPQSLKARRYGVIFTWTKCITSKDSHLLRRQGDPGSRNVMNLYIRVVSSPSGLPSLNKV